MIEVDPASVKPWLVQHLEPITDAEPATLAEYVLALLQRDETPQELERICIDSLGDFLEGHTESFVRDMLAFVRNPQPQSQPQSLPAPPVQRKRPLEDVTLDQSAAKRNLRPMPQQGQNGGLPKGMCRDYHMRGFCARGQSCPYQHDAFATAQPPPGAFPPFAFPFGGPGGGPGPNGQFPPPGMRPGMGPFPVGFPAQQGRGGPFGGQPGFAPSYGGPQNYPRQNGGPNFPPRMNHPGPGPHPHQQPSPFPRDQPSQGDQPFPFPAGPSPQANKRRPPPARSFEQPPPAPTPRVPSGPPPTPLTVLTHRFATNASRQKDLLAKLEACETADAKKEVMVELRKLNKEAEEIMALKKKVEEQQTKDAQEKEAKLKAKQLAAATAAAERASGEEGANGGADKEDLKAHLEKLRSEAAALGILPGQSNGATSSSAKPFPPSKRPYHHHPAGPPPPNRTAQSFRLDNRSANIVVESLESLGDPAEIKSYFETFGTVKEFTVKQSQPDEAAAMVDEAEEGEERGGEILVGFETRAIAEKAMSSGPPPSAPLAKLRWAPTTTTTTTTFGPPSGSVAAPKPASTTASTARPTSTTTVTTPAAAAAVARQPLRRPTANDDDRDGDESLADLPFEVQLEGFIDPYGVLDGGGGGRDYGDDDDERSWNR